MKKPHAVCIGVDIRKGCIGALLAFAVLVICAGSYSWKAGAVFAACFLLLGFLKIRVLDSGVGLILQLCYLMAGSVAVCWLSQRLMDFNSLWDLAWIHIAMGIVSVAIPMLLLFALALDARIAVGVIGTVLMLLVTANHYVYEFQGNELSPLTFLSAKTAANVIGNYDFTFPVPLVYSWILWGLLFFAGFVFPGIQLRNKIRSRGMVLLSAMLCLGVWHFCTRDIQVQTWGRSGTLINGYFLNFSLELKSAYVQKPEDYSAEKAEALEAEYDRSITDAPTPENKPDVIVIMSEAFSDLSILGAKIQTSQEVTPFYDSLTENTIRGYALSSAYGGMTANSEFEFLTGMSMGFLPTASVPYQQYISGTQPSLVSVMNENGYTCFATHPFRASGWSRERVYTSLGFDAFTFQEDYPQTDLIRDLVSDREMFAYLVKRYEQTREDERLFLFGITMQNHGSYDIAGYEPSIHLEGYQKQYDAVEQYLSLLHESDEALSELITYFETVPNDVIVVFFGDHLPDLPMEFYEEVHGGAFDTLDEQMLTYSVPFLIWANFDIPEQTLACTSLNYLSGYLLKTAGIPLPPYYQFLSELEAVIPAMNTLGFYSKTGESFAAYESASGAEADWLRDYAILQYYHLFDKPDGKTAYQK